MSDVKRQRIAAFLGLHPEGIWPIELLDRLIELEENNGREALFKELIKLCSRDGI